MIMSLCNNHDHRNFQYLFSIQFRYGSVWAPERGYTGNAPPHNEVFLDSGAFIDMISLWSGDILDLVTFFSDTGMSQQQPLPIADSWMFSLWFVHTK